MTVRQTPVTCPNTRHRSSTPAVDVRSAQFDAVQACSDTRAAPILLPRPQCRALRTCHRGGRRNRGDQQFPKPSTIVVALVDNRVCSTTLPPQARLIGSVCAAEIDGDDHTHRSEPDDGGYDDVGLRSSPRWIRITFE